MQLVKQVPARRRTLTFKWVAALRSGEYEQGTGTLCKDGKYCCLGVLQMVLDGDVERCSSGGSCDLPSHKWADDNGFADGVDEISSDGARWYARLPDRSPVARMNDRERLTFAQIADLIEEQL